jgi:anti-sigma factor RsiW
MTSHEHCETILENLSAYLDSELSDELCAAIERHLAGCADCQVVVDTLRKTISLYHALPQAELPDALRQRLYRTFDLQDLLPRDNR